MTERNKMTEYKPDMEITVWEKSCWICGKAGGYITSHHTIPKHLKPKKNFIIPICSSCHDEINKNDVRGIVSFAYKIQQSFNELTVMVENMVARMKSKNDNN